MNTQVLYVEDDPISREVMEMTFSLEVNDVDLTLFESSSDFIQRVEALPDQPDIILLDIHIGPIDGFAMLDQIRQHTTLGNAKVLAVTASVMNEEVDMLKRAGFDGGIAKPIDGVDFEDVCQRVLDGEKFWHIA